MSDERTNDDKNAETEGHFFNRLSNFIDKYLREVRFGRYVLFGTGTVLIVRSTHMLKNFRHVSEIPSHYVQKHVSLRGSVSQVTSAGILLVDHIPLVDISWMRKSQSEKGKLPIKLAAVDLEEDGRLWLQKTLPGKTVWFTPLKRNENLTCVISVKLGILRSCRVNEELVRAGMAKVQHIDGLSSDKLYIKLTNKLLKHELRAERKGKGVWKSPPISEQMKTYFAEKYLNLMAPFRRLLDRFRDGKR